MAIEGWYYLHTNGDLIYKREIGGTAADIRESDFARAMWPLDPTDRAGAWRIIVEAGALDAKKARVDQLAKLWGCTDQDAAVYADHVGCNIAMEGNAWCATAMDFINLQESPAGFGETAAEAMSSLCRELGYRGGKMWNSTFESLLASRKRAPAA